MKKQSVYTLLVVIFFLACIFTWALIGWDYLHDGVPSHHLLARKDLPEISNWWGALFIPLLSAVLLYRIKKRVGTENDIQFIQIWKSICIALLLALVYGISISIAFMTKHSDVSGLLFLCLFAIAIFLPIYRSEYYLGFVLGLLYTFGGVLPILIGLILVTISFILYKYVRPIFIWLVTKLGLIKK